MSSHDVWTFMKRLALKSRTRRGAIAALVTGIGGEQSELAEHKVALDVSVVEFGWPQSIRDKRSSSYAASFSQTQVTYEKSKSA
jgi:hypothetical protein